VPLHEGHRFTQKAERKPLDKDTARAIALTARWGWKVPKFIIEGLKRGN